MLLLDAWQKNYEDLIGSAEMLLTAYNLPRSGRRLHEVIAELGIKRAPACAVSIRKPARVFVAKCSPDMRSFLIDKVPITEQTLDSVLSMMDSFAWNGYDSRPRRTQFGIRR
jgi:hypothetical protein